MVTPEIMNDGLVPHGTYIGQIEQVREPKFGNKKGTPYIPFVLRLEHTGVRASPYFMYLAGYIDSISAIYAARSFYLFKWIIVRARIHTLEGEGNEGIMFNSFSGQWNTLTKDKRDISKSLARILSKKPT